MDPSSKPPDEFTCGNRDEPLNSMLGGQNAEIAAISSYTSTSTSSSTSRLGVGSYLYLDLMRRALTDYLASDLTREAEKNILSNTRHLASGNCNCNFI